MIVMKFGGTSVGSAESILRAAEIVLGRSRQKPVVVVSALARVTDQLLAMGNSARCGKLDEALELWSRLEQRHLEVLRATVNPEQFVEVGADLHNQFGELRAFLRGIAAIGELTARSTDRLLGFGECFSSRIVSEAFVASGLPAVLVDARECIVTDANYTRANPLVEEIQLRLAQKVLPLLHHGKVPVLAGFVGSTVDGVPTTLGRGGSDFTAAVVGAGVGAKRIEIWTDVDGMMTADPRLCPEAENIEAISFAEAAELAHFGAKVLHPKTLSPAIEKDIPVHILNSRHPGNRGTRVDAVNGGHERRVKAITHKRDIVVVEISSLREMDAALVRRIFEMLEPRHCLVDLVAMSRFSISLLVNSREVASELAERLEGSAQVQSKPGKAIVCLVGNHIARDSGVTGKVFSAIPHIELSLICHGGSNINISFVVDEEKAAEAVRLLHARFFPGRRRSNSADHTRYPAVPAMEVMAPLSLEASCPSAEAADSRPAAVPATEVVLHQGVPGVMDCD